MFWHEIDGVKGKQDDSLEKNNQLSYKLKSAQKQDLSQKSDSSSHLCKKIEQSIGLLLKGKHAKTKVLYILNSLWNGLLFQGEGTSIINILIWWVAICGGNV